MTKFLIDYVDPRSLVPYESNAKLHSKKQIDALANAIKKRGFDQPITVDDQMVIITGHGRCEAAILAGMETVPVIVRDDLSVEEVKAKRLEDNRLSSTDYDTEAMQEEIAALSSIGFDELFGFDDREMEMFLADPLMMTSDEDFINDLEDEAERQEKEQLRIHSEIAESSVPIQTVIGFKEIPVSCSRTVANWFGCIEEKHGCTGIAALMAHIEGIHD